jgi:hypothetical protein
MPPFPQTEAILASFAVKPDVDLDTSGVEINADHGIARTVLEDYFPWRRLTDQNRGDLLDDNKDAIANVMTHNYRLGEWSEMTRFGSPIRVVEVGIADLRAGPPLLEGRLHVQEGAGFQARG